MMHYNNPNIIPQNVTNIDFQTNQNIIPSSSPYPFINQQHHHHIMIPVQKQQQQQQQQQKQQLPVPPPSGFEGERREERYPQWTNQETMDLIGIRAQLEWDFSSVKRNKNLWEMVVTRMRERGYNRSIDQCKCKWKNLVNRYKGQLASDLVNGQQCPFFDELHAIFTARLLRLQQVPPGYETPSVKGKNKCNEEFSLGQVDVNETETNPKTLVLRQQQAPRGFETPPVKGKNKRKLTPEFQSNEESSLGQIDILETETNPTPKRNRRPAQSEKRLKQPITNNESVLSGIRDILGGFMQQQHWIDMQWQEALEKREKEREVLEQEWRGTMAKLERERIAMEQAWREKEEQRKLREESRAEKRDTLLNALMKKLVRDENA